MLNRRFLRVKAMQAVYSYRQSVQSNYFMTLEQLEKSFEPNILAEVQPDPKELKENIAIAKKLFNESYSQRQLKEKPSEEVTEKVMAAIDAYHLATNKDFSKVKKQMLEDTQVIVQHFFNILKFLTDLGTFIDKLKTKATQNRVKIAVASEFNLSENNVLMKLRESSVFQSNTAKYAEDWLGDDSILKTIYKEKIAEDEKYKEYTSSANTSFEEDQDILKHIVKKILLKNKYFLSHFEDLDVRWEENEEVVSILLNKTLKSVSEDEEVTFYSLSQNWEDDQNYFVKLYEETAKGNEQIQKKIKLRLKNWDDDRVAMIDHIIMEMALIEMKEFKSIPVKVSINEFIELAKKYSTPKSKVFINGILDTVSKELMKEGIIKKSGRGLIDNK